MEPRQGGESARRAFRPFCAFGRSSDFSLVYVTSLAFKISVVLGVDPPLAALGSPALLVPIASSLKNRLEVFCLMNRRTPRIDWESSATLNKVVGLAEVVQRAQKDPKLRGKLLASLLQRYTEQNPSTATLEDWVLTDTGGQSVEKGLLGRVSQSILGALQAANLVAFKLLLKSFARPSLRFSADTLGYYRFQSPGLGKRSVVSIYRRPESSTDERLDLLVSHGDGLQHFLGSIDSI